MFSTAGSIFSIYMPVVLTKTADGNKYLSKGFAFIEFNDAESIEKAMQLDGKVVQGARLLVKRRDRDFAKNPKSGAAEEEPVPDQV